MKMTTLKQARRVLQMLEDTPCYLVQNLLELGLLDDLLKATSTKEIDRNEFRKLCGLAPISIKFPIWKTIKRDPSLRTSEDFLVALTEKGFKISDWAKDIMSKDDFKDSLEGNSEQEYDLFLLTANQLTGKAENGTTQEIFAGAERLGFQKCPVWIGPQLRLNYENQPNNEWICIGMKPIADSDGAPRVFYVSYHDLLWFDAYDANPGRIWTSGTLWLFCRSRK